MPPTKEQRHQYYLRHKKEINRKHAEYYQRNRKQIFLQRKEYRKTHRYRQWLSNKTQPTKEQRHEYYLRHQKEYKRRASKYYKKNRKLIALKSKQYRETNKYRQWLEKTKDLRKAYYRQKHKETYKKKHLGYWKERYRKRLIKKKLYHSNYQKKNPIPNRLTSQKYYATKIKRARHDNSINSQTIALLLKKQKFACKICKVRFKNNLFDIDHIKPLTKGGIHSIKNIQLLCRNCHIKKTQKEITLK